MERQGVTTEFMVMVTLSVLFLVMVLATIFGGFFSIDTSTFECGQAEANLKEFRNAVAASCSTTTAHTEQVSFGLHSKIQSVSISEGNYSAQVPACTVTSGIGDNCDSVTICSEPASDPSASVDPDCEGGGELGGGSVQLNVHYDDGDVTILPVQTDDGG
jgi:hypothetical protein